MMVTCKHKHQLFASWQDKKMVVVTSGDKVFVAALYVQKYSNTTCTRIIQPSYNQRACYPLIS